MITRMVNAMGYLDDDLIAEAMERRKEQSGVWMKWGVAAACLVLTMVATFAVISIVFRGKGNESAWDGRYKDFSIQPQGEVAIIWPWEYQTAGERYRTLNLNGFEYGNTGNRVSEVWLDENLGIQTVNGYDMIKEEEHEIQAQVYSLQHAVSNMAIAVKLEDEYYAFRNYEYQPVNTLGELLDQVQLQDIVKLNWFEEKGGTSRGGRYVLNDASDLWNVLTKECREAGFVEDQTWMTRSREYLSFSISSEVLGIRNVALYVTTDGYLWTNAFGWQSIYDIGEESAGRIICLCRENSMETEAQPFTNAILGTVTEITEEYFVVDDSKLCKNPGDGICYKVLLNDIRISRHVMMNMIRVGDTVEVIYDGLINDDSDCVIDSAVNANKVTIVNGSAYVWE